jgi:hypothetical protein
MSDQSSPPPEVSKSPLNVSVLDFAAQEQKVNWGRIKKGAEYREEKIMKGVAIKTAKSIAIQQAVSGSADRAFAMRSRADEIKQVIIADIRRSPNEPHLWSQITREVAFGGEVGGLGEADNSIVRLWLAAAGCGVVYSPPPPPLPPPPTRVQ